MEMAENDPPGTKYVYLGALDDKTRDLCLDMISAGALTQDEIEAQFPGTFETAGGFACRHRWARQTSVSDKLTDSKGAEGKIKAKGDKWKKRLTPKQQINA